MGQTNTRQARFREPLLKREPRFREPLLKRDEEDDEPYCSAAGVCICLLCTNVLWALAGAYFLLFSHILLDLRDSNAATTWILRQLGKEDALNAHPLDDPWWITNASTVTPSPSTPSPSTPSDNHAALHWILNQLGEGDNLDEHPLDDPWWVNRTIQPLNLPYGPSYPVAPAVEWILLKLGQEDALRRYNVSDPWWTHRPQTNITLNATNVTVTPVSSAYVQSRRRLSSDGETSDGEQPTRLFVDGKVRVSEYVEYFSVPKEGYVKLIVAPESLRFVLKSLGMTERPWWDDVYWLTRDNKTDINITNPVNMQRMTAKDGEIKELFGEDVVIDGTLNTFGTVDFWPSHPSSVSRRLFVDDHSAQTCRRCAAISGSNCAMQCVPHMHILGGVLGFNNHTCTC
tara:strand:- start:976 stop:2175 length:1200 start_codon:yes stop_codon:yes gene_type:complete